jgi:hypothetical protein
MKKKQFEVHICYDYIYSIHDISTLPNAKIIHDFENGAKIILKKHNTSLLFSIIISAETISDALKLAEDVYKTSVAIADAVKLAQDAKDLQS